MSEVQKGGAFGQIHGGHQATATDRSLPQFALSSVSIVLAAQLTWGWRFEPSPGLRQGSLGWAQPRHVAQGPCPGGGLRLIGIVM